MACCVRGRGADIRNFLELIYLHYTVLERPGSRMFEGQGAAIERVGLRLKCSMRESALRRKAAAMVVLFSSSVRFSISQLKKSKAQRS
jgi:hypothetical protein